MEDPLASAVVLPQESPQRSASPPNANKRRRSPEPELDGKRQRVSGDANGEPPHDEAAEKDNADHDHPDRRRSSANIDVKERTRGKRLFGGLLGVLSQSAGGGNERAQKRRAEIEKRQKEKVKQQEEEDDQRKKERFERLLVQRKEAQNKVDEENLRVRHADMLDKAHFLRTKTEPLLYYRPWELTPEEEDQIDDQVADAQAQIDRELEEFEGHGGQKHEDEASRHAEGNHDEDEMDTTTVGTDSHPVTAAAGTNSNATATTTAIEDGKAATEPIIDSESALPDNQDSRDGHMDGVEAVNGGAQREGEVVDAAQDSTTDQDATMEDEGARDADDNNGEEVLEEAAEDTVIY